MNPLPAQDLRSNLGTWAVPTGLAPAVARVLLDALPAEPYDPEFRGQELATTYLDTADFALRKARRRGDKYLTLRIRYYRPSEVYALSAKTESRKCRVEIDRWKAEAILSGGTDLALDLLPADFLARLLDLAGDQRLTPVVTVYARRYAVEDAADRLTLDVDVRTDTGKPLSAGVLEFKSASKKAVPPAALVGLALRPVKISKFLWATLWR
jgi:hypothetical protein